MVKIDNQKIVISMLAVIVVALGYLGYIIASPNPGEKFTEFYILNVEGEAKDYPEQVVLGEPIDIIIGVVNHEYELTSYRIDIMVNGIKNKEISIGELAHEEEWQEIVSFTLDEAGDGQEEVVEFYLYKNNEAHPCLDLFLSWEKKDVIEP